MLKLLWLKACFYLQLLILQQLYHKCPHIIHCLLVTHEGEQVVENHNLEVCEHRVASVPGAAASNLQHTANPSHINNRLWKFVAQKGKWQVLLQQEQRKFYITLFYWISGCQGPAINVRETPGTSGRSLQDSGSGLGERMFYLHQFQKRYAHIKLKDVIFRWLTSCRVLRTMGICSV